jgi:hypothetical protein
MGMNYTEPLKVGLLLFLENRNYEGFKKRKYTVCLIFIGACTFFPIIGAKGKRSGQ